MRGIEDVVHIAGTEYHHITHVFRRKEGDEVSLSNGKGLLTEGTIKSITKKDVTIIINKRSIMQRSQPQIAIAFPLLKNKHDNVIIEKLTELGVSDFFPIITERTIRKPSGNTVEKFKKVAIAAMKQCDNAFLPQIHQVLTLSELIQSLKNYTPFVALEVGKNKTINEVYPELQEQAICLIIGPEGGFDNKEIEFLINNNVNTITLGNHILRAETAAITASAQLLAVLLEENPEYY
jgi:16S rRNA (uracil1498-N3)-methyltransferase